MYHEKINKNSIFKSIRENPLYSLSVIMIYVVVVNVIVKDYIYCLLLFLEEFVVCILFIGSVNFAVTRILPGICIFVACAGPWGTSAYRILYSSRTYIS